MSQEESHLRLVQATETDSERLKNFVNHQPFLVNAPVEIVTDRKGSFFDKYRLQSQDFVTYIMENKDGQIEGIASMIFRKTIINGEETLTGFATDLRITNSRHAIVQWPDLLLPALSQAAQERNCQYVFSILNATQTHAYNALIRPRSQRRSIPRYYLYRKYDLITLHGRIPFTNLPFLSTVRIEPMSTNDLEPLAQYLKSKAIHKPLSFPYSADLLNHRFQTWPGFEMKNFLIAKDSQKNIIGCAAPWKASQISSIIISKYSGFGETIYSFSKWLSYLNFVKRLPPEGQELKIKFLTHLYADNPDIFATILSEAFQITQKNELICYPHFEKTPLTMPQRNFLTSRMPFSIYTVMPPETPLPEFLQMHKVTPPPEIEPILV